MRRTHVVPCRASKWLDPPSTTGVLETSQVLGQMAAHVVRPPFFDHDLQGVTLGLERPFELGRGPLGEDRASSSDTVASGVGEVVLFMRIGDQVKEHLVGPGGVEAVVQRSQIEMVAEPYPSLARPRALAEDEVVASRHLIACLELGPPGDAVPVPRAAWRPGQVGHGGGDIEVVVEASDRCQRGRPARPGRRGCGP